MVADGSKDRWPQEGVHFRERILSRPSLSFFGLPLLVGLLAVLAALVILLAREKARDQRFSPRRRLQVGSTAQSSPAEAGFLAPADEEPSASPRASPQVVAPGVELQVEATAEAWLSISADGGASVGMLLKAGDKRRWRALRGFTLTVGNAGGVRLVLDGVELGPLGRPGQVMRGVELPSGWRSGSGAQ